MANCKGRINEGVYNCFGEIDESMCYDCIYNSDSKCKEKKNNFVSQKDKLEILYNYLTGERLPDGVYRKTPKLSLNKAFDVIWFLQEVLHCLPDNIEQCKGCKCLFDTDSEGCILDGDYKLNGKTLPKKYWGCWCDECAPNIDFELK